MFFNFGFLIISLLYVSVQSRSYGQIYKEVKTGILEDQNLDHMDDVLYVIDKIIEAQKIEKSDKYKVVIKRQADSPAPPENPVLPSGTENVQNNEQTPSPTEPSVDASTTAASAAAPVPVSQIGDGPAPTESTVVVTESKISEGPAPTELNPPTVVAESKIGEGPAPTELNPPTVVAESKIGEGLAPTELNPPTVVAESKISEDPAPLELNPPASIQSATNEPDTKSEISVDPISSVSPIVATDLTTPILELKIGEDSASAPATTETIEKLQQGPSPINETSSSSEEIESDEKLSSSEPPKSSEVTKGEDSTTVTSKIMSTTLKPTEPISTTSSTKSDAHAHTQLPSFANSLKSTYFTKFLFLISVCSYVLM